MSTVTLLMGPAIDSRLLENHRPWLDKAYAIFDEIILNGNVVASFRRSELQRLDEMLSTISSSPSSPQRNALPHLQISLLEQMPPPATQPVSNDNLAALGSGMNDEFSFANGMTTAQLMELAESIESGDTQWMSNTMIEHSIW